MRDPFPLTSHSHYRSRCALALVAELLIAQALPASAQSFGSAGSSWSTGWQFPSAADKSANLTEAQIIKNAEQGAQATSTVTYYTVNNNGADNITVTGTSGGTVTPYVHTGNTIGTNTNSVGSMNTGTTTLTVSGSSNTVSASNSSANQGATDGSVTSSVNSALASVLAATATVGGTTATGSVNTAGTASTATPTYSMDQATSGVGGAINGSY